MFAKIRHVAIYTENYERMANFYQTIFGMKKITSGGTDETGRFNPDRGHISDGVIGLALLQRHPGIQSGLDHFGFVVEDIAAVMDSLRQYYPDIMVAKSLDHVPFAAKRIHDPVGTHIDVSQKGEAKVEEHVQEGWEQVAHGTGSELAFAKLREGYIEEGWDQPRHLSHIAIRAKKPSLVAEFYQKVFELRGVEGFSANGEVCLTDGKVYLLIRPCHNRSYRTMKEGLDHIGFKVESLEQAKRDLDDIARSNPQCAPRKITVGTHGAVTQEDIDACMMGRYGTSDPDGVLFDLSE